MLDRCRGLLTSPRMWKWFHGISAALFFVQIPFAITIWKDSVPYLVGISVWTAFSGEMAAWAGSRIEVKQDEDREEASGDSA